MPLRGKGPQKSSFIIFLLRARRARSPTGILRDGEILLISGFALERAATAPSRRPMPEYLSYHFIGPQVMRQLSMPPALSVAG